MVKIKIKTELTIVFMQEIEVTPEELEKLEEYDGDSIPMNDETHDLLMNKLDLDDWFHWEDFEDFEIFENE